ncbi:MAG TPA: class I SAM-dependent methyltransferase [Polyangiaceae bacterium]|nr:class I SAM-dependent methyltransferase [Polyangiaceae bacterium]
MPAPRPYPLDYREGQYAYIERENNALLALFERHVLGGRPAPRVLDVGAGAGANVRALKKLAPAAHITAIEPNAAAAALAASAADEVFQGSLEAWLETKTVAKFQVVMLSDVIEHVENPVRFLERLLGHASVEGALFLVSVPNYAVWYNRVTTLLGRFDYSWSGLRDRTHLRFFTRSSIRELLEYVGLDVLEQTATPSLAQAAAPWLRRLFERDVERGDHLSLQSSRWYRGYGRWVEPLETRICGIWPQLFGFQIVSAARAKQL